MKQIHIIADVFRADPHRLQMMLNELDAIDGVTTKRGMIEYDENDQNAYNQIKRIVNKYQLPL